MAVLSIDINRQAKPLLYIDQPRLPYQDPEMQTIFKDRIITKRPKTKKESSEEVKSSEISEKNIELVEEDPPTKKVEKRRFKDFSLEEKINHFLDMPFHVPKPPCEITTDEKIYKGYLIKRSDEFVILQTPNKAKTIPIKEIDIKDIKLYGL